MSGELNYLSTDFGRLEAVYLQLLAKLPVLYTLIYKAYREEVAAHSLAEPALLLALGILLAQALGQRHQRAGELGSKLGAGSFSGRLCFKHSELLALLREGAASGSESGSVFATLKHLTATAPDSLPGFCAIEKLDKLAIEVNAKTYFCHWHGQRGQGFALARLARLQKSLWNFIAVRSARVKIEALSLLAQPELLQQTLTLWASTPGHAANEQRLELLQDCVAKLCQSHLLLIAGGPGSGKTTLLASLLQLLRLAQQNASAPVRLELALCAPTARAAQRMLQSLHDIAGAEVADIAAVTLHRLLGLGQDTAELYRPATVEGQKYLQPKGVKLLCLDLLVVDEASMLDSEMAHRLLASLHPQTHIIFLGDPEQLAPVGLGAFWQDLLTVARAAEYRGAAAANCNVANCLVELHASYRSVAAIKQLSQSVLLGRELGRELLEMPQTKIVSWQKFTLPQRLDSSAQTRDLLHYLWQNWCPNKSYAIADIDHYFNCLQKFTILTPRQNGGGGAHLFNQWLRQYGAQQLGLAPRSQFFHGCPIQITRNNYQLGVYNGDRGFCLDWNYQLYAVFAKDFGGRESRENLEVMSKYRWLPLSKLDYCEASFVQTIHKSQGSEYRKVCVLLPEVGDCWSKPLLYTAITRARQQLCFVGSEAAVAAVNTAHEPEPFNLWQQFAAE